MLERLVLKFLTEAGGSPKEDKYAKSRWGDRNEVARGGHQVEILTFLYAEEGHIPACLPLYINCRKIYISSKR